MAYLNSRRSEAPKSTLRRATSFKMFARWAWKMIVLDDYILPTPKKAAAHPLPDGMEDVDKMLACARTHDQVALIVLQSRLGCRVSEARNVCASDFDENSMELTIRGKGDKTRVVPYSTQAMSLMLEAYQRSFADGLPMVRLSDSGARAAIKTIAYIAGVQKNVASHDLRSTCLTDLHDRTKDLQLVAEFAGHGDINVTRGYVRTDRKSMREAVNF